MQDVIEFVVDAHKGQFRKGNKLPFIVHPFAVLSLITDWGVKCDITKNASLCHDSREDNPDVTYEKIKKVIGKEGADIVEELSFFPDPKSGVSVSKQKAKYMDGFLTKSVPALVIKVADRICNTRDFYQTDPEYASIYWNKALNLFDVMITRGEEITKVFGPEVFTNMKYAKNKTQTECVRKLARGD